MGFGNTSGVVVGRLLRLIGTGGTKIIGQVVGGVPRIDFYTGDPNEDAPSSLFTAQDDPFPGSFVTVLQSALADDGRLAALRLGTLIGVLLSVSAQGQTLRFEHTFSGNNIEIGPADFGGISIEALTGAINMSGNVNLSDLSIGNTAKRIEMIDFGDVSDNTSLGNGTLNFPHNLGGPASDLFIWPIRTAAASSFLTRFPAGDTASTFECRATLAGGGAPPNGTSIPCTYFGLKRS